MFNDWLQRFRLFSEVFEKRGKRVVLVGGALRNRLLGSKVEDFDFATDATPQEVMSMFRRVIPTGLAHGTVTVLFEGQSLEVTTFRIDGDYSDHRRPDRVAFSTELAQDLARRDFTINALALDLGTGELFDNFGGQDDLKKKIVRAIGDPRLRFDEDALRILRLFRFAAQLGFEIDPASLAAAVERKTTLAHVSRERIRDEWLKMWGAPHVGQTWPLMESQGFIGLLASPLSPAPCPSEVIESWLPYPTLVRVAIWLAACAREGNHEQFLRGLKLANQEIAGVLNPLGVLAELGRPESPLFRAKRLVARWGGRGRAGPAIDLLNALETSRAVTGGRLLANALSVVKDSLEPVLLRELAIGGTDLLLAGVPPGPEVGRMLQKLLEIVWEQPLLNDPQKLLKLIR